MAALWLVEGMLEDGVGTGFFRVAVVTTNETTLPNATSLYGWVYRSRLVEIRRVELAQILDASYRPSKLKIPPEYDRLSDEVKDKLYTRFPDRWVLTPDPRQGGIYRFEPVPTVGTDQTLVSRPIDLEYDVISQDGTIITTGKMVAE